MYKGLLVGNRSENGANRHSGVNVGRLVGRGRGGSVHVAREGGGGLGRISRRSVERGIGGDEFDSVIGSELLTTTAEDAQKRGDEDEGSEATADHNPQAREVVGAWACRRIPAGTIFTGIITVQGHAAIATAAGAPTTIGNIAKATIATQLVAASVHRGGWWPNRRRRA